MKAIQLVLISVVVFLTLQSIAQAPQIECRLVDPRDTEHDPFFPICDLNDLDGFRGSMTFEATGNGPTPLCNKTESAGSPHNIIWFSFIAGEGDYAITMTLDECINGNNGDSTGVIYQTGIYDDCDWSNQVGLCFGIPCVEGPVSISNIDTLTGEYILIPGQAYYWFIDGCTTTICDFQLSVAGSFIELEEIEADISLSIFKPDKDNEIRIYADGADVSATNFYWSINANDPFQVLNNVGTSQNIITRNNFIDLEFTNLNDVQICLESIDFKCAGLKNEACIELNDYFHSASGTAFIDDNNNGVFDSLETRLRNVNINSNGFSILTNSDGYYSLPVVNGQVNINGVIPYGSWINKSIIIDTFILDSSLDAIDFDYKTFGDPINFSARITSTIFRCNVLSYISPIVFNKGNIAISGTMSVKVDPKVLNVTSMISIDSIVNNTYYFTFSDVLPGDLFSPYLRVLLPGAQNIGDTLEFNVFVKESMGKVDDNSLKQVFRCSYDPNDKNVQPDRLGDENYTLRDERLDYHIRFQNNGNDTAFHVQIVDVLDSNIDLNSLILIDNSHPVRVTTHLDSVFFDFDGIELVDSLTNFEASQGYVTFSVETLEGIPENTVIENTAGIYFDLNPPIITNTIQNTIVTFLPCAPVELLMDSIVCRVDVPTGVYGYIDSGIYMDTFNLFDNCDSIRILELTINEESFSEQINFEICDGDSIVIGGLEYAEDGDYQVLIGSNINGCDSIAQFTVTTNQHVITTLPSQLICLGDTIVVAGVPITEADVYTLDAGQTSLGCDSSVFITVLFDSEEICDPVSNINQQKNPILQIFPNPVKDQITYTLVKTQESSYSIYSLHGQLLLSGEGDSSQVEIDLLALKQGTFILKVVTSDGSIGVRKLVKL